MTIFDWLFRIHFPSIKDYSFIPQTDYGWGQYVIIDEPSVLYHYVDTDDILHRTKIFSKYIW